MNFSLSLRSLEVNLGQLRDLPARTRDGTQIRFMGNIEFPQEATAASNAAALGVGLYRTEFIYLNTRSHGRRSLRSLHDRAQTFWARGPSSFAST